MKFTPLSFFLAFFTFLLASASPLPTNMSPNPVLQPRDYWMGEMDLCVTSGSHCTLATYYNPLMVDIVLYAFDYWCNQIGFNPGVAPSALANGFDFDSQLPDVIIIWESAPAGGIATATSGNWAPTFAYNGQHYDPINGQGSITHVDDGWGGYASVMPFSC
jgi:hypothetical protein